MNTEHWQDLLNDALDGDTEALGVLCQEYLKPKLLRLIRKKMQEEDQVEDIVQSVFERLIASSQKIEERDLTSFRCFVFRIAANECINRIRRRHHATSFRLTQKTFASLESAGVPETVVQRLQSLQDREVIGHQNFTRLLRNELGEHHTPDISAAILQCTEKVERLADYDVYEHHASETEQEALITQREIHGFVYHAIRNALNEEEWRIFELRDLEEQTYREISAKIGMRLATVHARHNAIYTKLKQDKTLLDRWKDLKEDVYAYDNI